MSPPSEGPPDPAFPAPGTEHGEFTPEERGILLALAREAILSTLENREISLQPPSSHLGEPRGVFTTIHVRGVLRGCVGLVSAVKPLYRNVVETACAAAFEDARFPSVTREELPHLALGLSILSPLKPIAAEEIETGRHGLVISLDGHRGLLLPQVPVEHGWDRIAFLEQTCRKAGLSVEAWKHGAQIEAFTAEVFGDQDPR